MLKTTLAALAVLSFSLLVAPAAFVAPAAASAICNEGCPESSEPPSSQEDDGGNGHGGPGGNGGDIAPISAEESLAKLEKTCNAALQKLVQIPEKLVTSFSPDGSVSVIAVCNSGLGHQAAIDGSQALPLQHAIAANPTMAAALQEQGFHAEDVVGVIVSNDIATLYVHKGTA